MYAKFVNENRKDLENVALAVRLLSMDAVLQAKSGHIGLPLGGAEIGAFLYFAVMHYNSADPQWVDRDRFVLSAGHGSMLLYSLLHLAEYPLSIKEISQFRQLGSYTPGHPEYGHTAGVECTTGPLGQGISNAVGMALAERMLAARFNNSLSKSENIIDHRTFVLAGDGCLMEGVSAEASSFAGHLKLNRLIVLYDSNHITIDGTTDISFTEDVAKRYEAYGWNVLYADGNCFDSLAKAMDEAIAKSELPNGETGPTLIVCTGIPGKGSPKWEGKHKIHGNPMSKDDVIDAKKHLGVENVEPFFVPERCYQSAQRLLQKRKEKALQWQEQLGLVKSLWEKNNPEKLTLWRTLIEKKDFISVQEVKVLQGKIATRVAGGQALAQLAEKHPALVGGSADLAGSNLTTLANSTFVNAKDFSGRNIHFGVREHGMAAICNGVTLHGGLQAYCATFAVFSDYMRPAIRLAALMKIPTIFILTHDSYSVGEDGPTHQPIEHAASLRAIPHLQVFRPADGVETFAAWENAVSTKDKPTALLLTRQDVDDLDQLLAVPRLKDNVTIGLRCGGYLLKDFSDENPNACKIVLVGSGSEVALAYKAALLLEKNTFATASGQTYFLSVRVISAPAPQVLAVNPVILNALLPKELPIFAIEAGAAQGWGEITGRTGAILAMKDFGASAPAGDLAKYFGFVPEKLAQFVTTQLGLR